jgi:hypothetical protein
MCLLTPLRGKNVKITYADGGYLTLLFLNELSIALLIRPIGRTRRITLHVRFANHMVMDSYCRGGIVHIRCVRYRALLVRLPRPKALWRFRASTLNSLIGRTRLHIYTHIRYIYHTYVQQDIRVCEDDHFQPPKRQFPNPKAL